MFIIRPKTSTQLETVIDQALTALDGGPEPDTKEYATIVDQIVKLHALKQADKPARPSYDTLALVLGNILGILMITNREKTEVLTTKALSMFKFTKNP